MSLDCFDGECVYCDCEENDENIMENQKTIMTLLIFIENQIKMVVSPTRLQI